MSLRVVLLSFMVAACAATTLYNPPNIALDQHRPGLQHAGNALDSIETALSQIVNNPHLPAAQLKDAKAVATSVEATVEELESPKGKLLGKDARAAKVMSAIKLLQTLQDKWQKVTTDSVSVHKAELMKHLKDNEDELAKEEKMLKVLNLEKKLAEKKLALENLIEAKNTRVQKEAAAKDIAARQDMVASVLNMAKSLQAAQGKNTSMVHAVAKVVDGKAAMLKTVLAHLEGRMQNLTAAIAKIDAAEKRGEAKVKEVVKAPVTGKDDALGKGQSMLKMLLKKEHRQFEKARAPLKSELKELSEAVMSIKKGDTKGLTEVMTHMQSEMKKIQAKGGKFLY